MKTKQQKKESLKKLEEKLSDSKITVFTSFARPGTSGLGVRDLQTLRKNLREAGGEYVVEKKTIVQRALRSMKLPEVNMSTYDGSLGTAIGHSDPVSTAKALYEFSKGHEALRLFGAFYEGQYLDQEQVIAFAKIPGREALLGH